MVNSLQPPVNGQISAASASAAVRELTVSDKIEMKVESGGGVAKNDSSSLFNVVKKDAVVDADPFGFDEGEPFKRF